MNDDFGGVYVSALYTSTTGDSLTLIVEKISDEQYDTDYILSTERDLDDAQIFEINGINYYYVTNLDSNSFVWQNDNTIFGILTTYDVDVIKQMLESIHHDIEE